jgi:hypothetical protein
MRTREQQRIYEARVEARQLGHSLFVEKVPGSARPAAYVAAAAPHAPDQATFARELAYGASASEAAEAGLEVLRSKAASKPGR